MIQTTHFIYGTSAAKGKKERESEVKRKRKQRKAQIVFSRRMKAGPVLGVTTPLPLPSLPRPFPVEFKFCTSFFLSRNLWTINHHFTDLFIQILIMKTMINFIPFMLYVSYFFPILHYMSMLSYSMPHPPLHLDSGAQIGRIIHSVSREKGAFHRRSLLVADKSAVRSAKDAIGASRARGEPREDAHLVVQHEATTDDGGLPARLLLRKFPPIWKYARVSLDKPRRFECAFRHAKHSKSDESEHRSIDVDSTR